MEKLKTIQTIFHSSIIMHETHDLPPAASGGGNTHVRGKRDAYGPRIQCWLNPGL